MEKKLKVTAVSYLNTKPFLYGLMKSGMDEHMELSLDIPSACAEKLASGEADLGLVPVAVIPALKTPHIISDFCIGCNGEVHTVAVFSQRPIEDLKTIYLDFHSKTSVNLFRVLLRDYWKLEIDLVSIEKGETPKLDEKSGILLIGDKTIGLHEQYEFVYDLGAHWKKHTGLPFVFAAWVSNKPLPHDFVKAFNEGLKTGLDYIPQLMMILPQPSAGFDLKKYYTDYIDYHFDAPKKKALQLFLESLHPEQIPATLNFS